MFYVEGSTLKREQVTDVDWYRDRCGDHLNTQPGFDDHRYLWPCEECGHKSSISSANTYDSHEDYGSSSTE